ncbi:MAG TPA: methyltransferase [Xanthobacteraceae bacterium]|jgi:23S rRNA (uracil1939-C5)-methyltransferase|nr:methyltransferase [Xanthobacteraceae bacterium]
MAERFSINTMGHRGDGVAQTPNGPVFIPFTLPGETVEAEPAGERAAVLRIIASSAERILPFCPHFGTCGGCAIQHWRPDAYAAWKENLVRDALAQAGLGGSVAALVDAHGEGRRRAVFHARRDTDSALHVGYAAARAHHIVPIENCPILAPGLTGALAAARAVAALLSPLRKPLDLHFTATGTGLDLDIRGSGALNTAQTTAVAKLATTHRLARITRHGELVIQSAAPALRMGKANIALPPGAFLQATAKGEEVLSELVLGLVAMHAPRARQAADLFCGVGPFSLRLAEKFRVTAIDNHTSAIAALTAAVASTRGLKPLTATTRDLFRVPLADTELKSFDVVVFDPPRQGAEAQARALAASKVPLVIGVSCNVATFARDAAILRWGGYEMQEVTPVDQFRHSAHVELVAAFKR